MGIHNVALSDEAAAAVGGLVASGRYGDAAEALRAGLALLRKDEAEWQAFLDRINGAYDRAKAGERAPGTADEVMVRVMARARERWQAKRGEGDAA